MWMIGQHLQGPHRTSGQQEEDPIMWPQRNGCREQPESEPQAREKLDARGQQQGWAGHGGAKPLQSPEEEQKPPECLMPPWRPRTELSSAQLPELSSSDEARQRVDALGAGARPRPE